MEFQKFAQPKLAKLELLVKLRVPVGENIKHEFLRKAIVLNFLEIDERHGLTKNDLFEEIGRTKNYVASDDQTWFFLSLRVLEATRTAVTAQLLSHILFVLLVPAQSTGGEIRLYFVEKGVHKFLYQGRVKEYVHDMEEIIEGDVGNVDKTEKEEKIQESKENEKDTEESNEKLNVLDHVLNISERVSFSIAESSSNPFINALLGIAGNLEDAPRMDLRRQYQRTRKLEKGKGTRAGA
ncbi:hypothetical protein CAEBREN_20786 [Caenorhabditis brenneri]|uniref:SPK domain-containing protein n=1 Tax=Caenorhabditis brenneri TaxID=135651 RepID=G0ND76_CAEBE|nr:hypothetical protein CAEBREN_20786 [Caenorhabditis brenneri]